MAREDMKWSHRIAGTQAADPREAQRKAEIGRLTERIEQLEAEQGCGGRPGDDGPPPHPLDAPFLGSLPEHWDAMRDEAFEWLDGMGQP